jgi:hypothetical protein
VGHVTGSSARRIPSAVGQQAAFQLDSEAGVSNNFSPARVCAHGFCIGFLHRAASLFVHFYNWLKYGDFLFALAEGWQ